MKLNQMEKSNLSTAIDKLTEGLDEIIELYNESVEDKPLVEFSEELTEKIKKAIHKYGEEHVNRKISTLVAEFLEWLPLEEVELEGEGAEGLDDDASEEE